MSGSERNNADWHSVELMRERRQEGSRGTGAGYSGHGIVRNRDSEVQSSATGKSQHKAEIVG